MKLVADCHFHTISSGHAYSTINEYAKEASDKGLELIEARFLFDIPVEK